MKVLISGASIAGPALAYWLHNYGFDVTVVEKAAQVRPGGQAVDFKGSTHRTVLGRMGILKAVLAAQVGSNDGIIVNANGRKIGLVPGAFSGGEINVPRGDLAKILYERTAKTCNYVFNDSITSLNEIDNGVSVSFNNSAPQTFDIVVGADGIHSNVRKLAFGPESNYVSYLGYYYANFIVKDSGDEMYNEPGRVASTSNGKDPSFFVFKSEPLDYDRDNIDQQKQLLSKAYAGSKWKVPQLLAQLPNTPFFYMDSISRVKLDHYSNGRIVLLGDAAYGNALGGFGTGLSIVGAYVLAGELFRAKGDYKTAFAQYEAKFKNYASVSQKVNAGKLLAPATQLGIWLRNRLFSVAFLFAPLMKLSDRFATDIKLEDYSTNQRT